MRGVVRERGGLGNWTGSLGERERERAGGVSVRRV